MKEIPCYLLYTNTISGCLLPTVGIALDGLEGPPALRLRFSNVGKAHTSRRAMLVLELDAGRTGRTYMRKECFKKATGFFKDQV